MSIESPIILGSGSSFRRDLLASTGLKFEVSVADCNEKVILADTPIQTASARALAKARAVSAKNPGAVVIGCDQVLDFQGRTMDKVYTPGDAASRLKEIQGNHHYLHSAYSLVKEDVELAARVVTITMTMRTLDDDEIDAYVATEEWKGCVGCYQYENRGGSLFLNADGTQDAIIGLPLKELLADIQLVRSSDS